MRPLVLDLGCGSNKRAGAVGLDCRLEKGVDIVCDLEYPLPLADGVAAEVHVHHVLEHVRNLIPLMEEIYRVCRPGAVVRVSGPYYTSRGAYRDPTHVRFLTEDTFQYFEVPTDYGTRTNFAIERIEYEVRRPFRYLPAFVVKYCRRHLWNVVDSFWVTLRVVKGNGSETVGAHESPNPAWSSRRGGDG
jgi:SAM-dependent methyltransferase